MKKILLPDHLSMFDAKINPLFLNFLNEISLETEKNNRWSLPSTAFNMAPNLRYGYTFHR